MDIKRIFDLSITLDKGSFKKVWKQCYSEKKYSGNNGCQYFDLSMEDKGLIILYQNSQYQKKIRIYVNQAVVESNLNNTEKFIQKLDKRISEYFHSEYLLHDFTLHGLYMSTDIGVGNSKNAAAYLKVLHRLGKVKGFSPSDCEGLDDDSYLCLDGNSNAISFTIYDLAQVMLCQRDHLDIGSKHFKKIVQNSEGILRTEIRLTKPKAIRSYTCATTSPEQISDLSENSQDIFMDIFTKVVPYGDFYKKEKAMEIIQNEVKNSVMRKKMLYLLDLIPQKKSLLLAQKASNCRRNDEVMKAFADIGLSPITISKRQKTSHLQNLYNFLFINV